MTPERRLFEKQSRVTTKTFKTSESPAERRSDAQIKVASSTTYLGSNRQSEIPRPANALKTTTPLLLRPHPRPLITHEPPATLLRPFPADIGPSTGVPFAPQFTAPFDPATSQRADSSNDPSHRSRFLQLLLQQKHRFQTLKGVFAHPLGISCLKLNFSRNGYLPAHVHLLPIQSSYMLQLNFTAKSSSCTILKRISLGRAVLVLPPQTPSFSARAPPLAPPFHPYAVAGWSRRNLVLQIDRHGCVSAGAPYPSG